MLSAIPFAVRMIPPRYACNSPRQADWIIGCDSSFQRRCDNAGSDVSMTYGIDYDAPPGLGTFLSIPGGLHHRLIFNIPSGIGVLLPRNSNSIVTKSAEAAVPAAIN